MTESVKVGLRADPPPANRLQRGATAKAPATAPAWRLPLLLGVTVAVTSLVTIALYDRAMAHRYPGGPITGGDPQIAEAKRLAHTLAVATGGDVEALAAVKARELPMTGVLATNTVTGDTFVAWSLADGGAFALGPVIDPTGANLTFRYEMETIGDALTVGGRLSAGSVLESHPLVSKEEWAALAQTQHVSIGNGPRQMLAFFDPDCSYCQQMISDLESRQDEFRVLLVPVSPNDGVEAVQSVADSFWPGEDAATAYVREHNALLERVAGRRATPTLVYEDRSGRLRLKIGAPQSDERWKDLWLSMASVVEPPVPEQIQ